MNLPLPKEIQQAARSKNNCNAGLWYDKFFDRWTPDFTKVQEDKERSGKADWVKMAATQRCGDKDL